MASSSAADVAGMGLTLGSIVKIGVVEWSVCEILILVFVLLRGTPKTRFSLEMDGSTLAAAGNPVGDFIVLSLLALGAVAVLSLCFFIGQTLLGPFLPLNLRFTTRS